MSDLSQLNSFESIIEALEKISPGPGLFPGTRLNRMLIDKDIAEVYKLGPPPGDQPWPPAHAQVRAWCLALGRAGHHPQHIFYGWEIGETVSKAVKELLLGKATA